MNSIKYSSAFTLIELLVSLGIISILMALAAPSFQRLAARTAIKNQAWEIRRSLELARSLAVSQKSIWKVCTANLSFSCVKEKGQRLLVFADSNNDNQFNGKDVLHRDHKIPDLNIKLSASGRLAVRFKPNGEAMDSGNFLICGQNQITDFGRQTIIFRSGRVRLSKDTNNDGYDNRGQKRIICQ